MPLFRCILSYSWFDSPPPLSLYGKEHSGYSSKHCLLCSTEEIKSYRFGTKWCWINNDHFRFWVNYPSKMTVLEQDGLSSSLSFSDLRDIIRNSRTMHSAALKELFAKWVIVQPCPSSLKHTHIYTVSGSTLLSGSSRLNAPPDFAPERENRTI